MLSNPQGFPNDFQKVLTEWPFEFTTPNTKKVRLTNTEARKNQRSLMAFVLIHLVEECKQLEADWPSKPDDEKDSDCINAIEAFHALTVLSLRPNFLGSTIKAWPKWTHAADLHPAEQYNRAYQALRCFKKIPRVNGQGEEPVDKFGDWWTSERLFERKDISDHAPGWVK